MHARGGEQTRITGSRLANEFEFAACFSLVGSIDVFMFKKNSMGLYHLFHLNWAREYASSQTIRGVLIHVTITLSISRVSSSY